MSVMRRYGPAMSTAITDQLHFFAAPGPITAIDAAHAPMIEGVGDDPLAMAKAVRGVLVHRDWAPLMGLDFPPERLADQHIRPVNEMLSRIGQLSPGALPERRQPADRMVGVCRHFAVLHVALLRRHGIPARARAGF